MRWTALLLASSVTTLAGCDLVSCGSSSTSSGAGLQDAGTGVSEGPIAIGEIISMSGAVASFGLSTRNGIQLAVDQCNKDGGVRGRRLEIHFADPMGSAELAAHAMRQLIDEERVKLVLGEIESNNSNAMAVIAQQRQVPMISPSSTSPKVTENRDYVSRVCFVDPFQGFVMAKFAREHLKLQRVAVLKDPGSDYSMGLADVFIRKFTELGGKVVADESYSKGDQDFRAQITRIAGEHPEALYVPGYYNEVAVIAKQARDQELRVPLLGGDGWDSAKLYELGGPALDGHYFSNHYSPEDPSPRSQRFITDYKKAFGTTPDSLAALGYDAARVAIEAMKRAHSLDGPGLRDAIAKTKDFAGVTGNISLDSNRNAVKPAVVLQITDGRAKFVTTVSP